MSRLRTFASSVGTALNNMAIASHDAESRRRILEIDEEMLQLRMERDHLLANLYEPKSDEGPSARYIPGQWKPHPKSSSGEGRLTQCKGRDTMGTYHNAHPGCPYIDRRHVAHEFTLRD